MNSRANRLITIPISHFCEKARWGLEWADIPYVEDRHLQGFHYFFSYGAARSPSVPVLVTAGETLRDSTDILHWCDSQASSSRKFRPADAELRREADRLEDRFDLELGVAGRLWMYSQMLHDIPLILKYSRLHRVPAYEIRLMPWLFPLVKGHIQSDLGLKPDSREKTKAIVDRVFDDVARQLEGKEFLVGGAFSNADITFAALAASVLIPENYGVQLPSLEELPAGMREQIEVWRRHPAGEFALRLYRDFRGR